jgi:hypothetical protein
MFREQIARGVELLNEKFPGWFKGINLEDLNLEDVFYSGQGDCGCVLAQVAYLQEKDKLTGYNEGYRGLCDTLKLLPVEPWPRPWSSKPEPAPTFSERNLAAHYGFNLHYTKEQYDSGISRTDEYRQLTEEWKEVIRGLQRRQS